MKKQKQHMIFFPLCIMSSVLHKNKRRTNANLQNCCDMKQSSYDCFLLFLVQNKNKCFTISILSKRVISCKQGGSNNFVKIH